MVNKIILIGRLTRDPELRYSSDGKAYTNFCIAVNRNFDREKSDFLDCVCFGKTAENVSTFTKKGDKICVFGSVQIDSYTNNNGEKKKSVKIVSKEVEFLNSKPVKEESTDGWEDFGKEINANYNTPF